MSYEALLIDLDGVLRRWDGIDARAEAEFGLPAGAIAQIAFAPGLLAAVTTGQISDEAWRATVAAELGRAYRGCDAAHAMARWSESSGAVDADVLDLIDRCRGHLRVVLVTNATSRLRSDLLALDLTSRFHAVVNSSEIGIAKPAQGIYRAALQRAGVPAARAMFVDDSAANVDAADRLGITGHRFVGSAAMAAFLQRAGALDEAAP